MDFEITNNGEAVRSNNSSQDLSNNYIIDKSGKIGVQAIGLIKKDLDKANDLWNYSHLPKLALGWEEFRIKNCYTMDDFAAQCSTKNYSLYIVRAYSDKENIHINVIGNVPEERLLEIPKVINYLRVK